MMACGTTPVVGESEYASVSGQPVRWATPTPLGLADALTDIVNGRPPMPAEIASSVRGTRWDAAQRVTLETIEDEVYGVSIAVPLADHSRAGLDQYRSRRR